MMKPWEETWAERRSLAGGSFIEFAEGALRKARGE